jgi:hypothetical protein
MTKKKTTGKLPWFKFFPNDWARDLEEHPLEIEGAWIRICCKLWSQISRGQGSKTLAQWAKILGVDNSKALDILKYINAENIANISANLTEPNGIISIVSRRMEADEKARAGNADRQRKHYHRHKPEQNLTPTLPPYNKERSEVRGQKTEEETQEERARVTTNWEIQAVFDGWQTTTLDHPKMVSHETLTSDHRAAIAKAISEHSDPSKIIKAFENYATTLQGDEYTWSHAWPIDFFLDRGLSRFLDEAKPLENYHVKNTGGQDGHSEKNTRRNYPNTDEDAGKFEGC